MKIFISATPDDAFRQRLCRNLEGEKHQITESLHSADYALLIDGAAAGQSSAECLPIIHLWRHADSAPHAEALDFRSDSSFDEPFMALRRRLEVQPAPRAVLYNLPDLLPVCVERPELDTLCERILRRDERINAVVSKPLPNALYGLAGIGKSTLTNMLCRRCDVRRHFRDGIVWINCGTNANPLGLLQTLGAAFDVPLAELVTEQPAQVRLQRELRTRRCLIVLDDVWDHELAKLFQQLLGSDSRLLITTRQLGIAQSLHAQPLLIESLSSQQGAELLRGYIADLSEGTANDIATILNGHPLALYIAAMWILGHGVSEAPALLRRLRERETFRNLRLKESDRNLHLEYSLRLSYDDLKQGDNAIFQFYFRQLGVLAPNEPFSKEAAGALWELDGDALSDALHALYQKGLLFKAAGDGDSEPRYYTHSLIHLYARKLLEAENSGQEFSVAAKRHFTFFFEARHLQRADRARLLTDLPNILVAFDFAADHDPRAAVDWAMKLNKTLGKTEQRDLHRTLLERALEAAQRTDQRAGEAFLLRALYNLTKEQRHGEAARRAFREATAGRAHVITLQMAALLEKDFGNF
ncbi:MAG: NB-ARC domain-containing protein, partial [Anaerolineae bacterium]|nr:NB-ARC domain-containing protein [Anaerolineae bacterium]